jgi:hypothetical protein
MPIPLPAINAPAGSRCLLSMLCVMVSLPAFAQTAPPPRRRMCIITGHVTMRQGSPVRRRRP